jgi:hypothetical protein
MSAILPQCFGRLGDYGLFGHTSATILDRATTIPTFATLHLVMIAQTVQGEMSIEDAIRIQALLTRHVQTNSDSLTRKHIVRIVRYTWEAVMFQNVISQLLLLHDIATAANTTPEAPAAHGTSTTQKIFSVDADTQFWIMTDVDRRHAAIEKRVALV